MSASLRDRLLWLGLALAFSPVLLNLFADLREHPAQRYVLLAPPLIGLLLRRDPGARGTRHVGAGVGMLAFGLAVQSVGIAAGAWSIARVGLPAGMLGVALLAGRPAPAVMALGFAAIPLPSFVAESTSPSAESWLGAGAAEVLSWLGVKLEAGGPLLQAGGEHLELVATDNGVVTAFVLAAMGWYRALRSGGSAAVAARHALLWAAATIAVQPALVLLGVAALPLGAPGVGRFLLSHGVWLGLAAAALVAHARGGRAPALQRRSSGLREERDGSA